MNNILIHYIKNGEEIKQFIPYNFVFDRINSIKARIAKYIESLPRLILYEQIESKDYEFNIESFKIDVESLSVSDFMDLAKSLMKKYNIKTKRDYTLYFIYYNKNFRNKKKLSASREGYKLSASREGYKLSASREGYKLYRTLEELEKSKTGVYEEFTTSTEDFYGETKGQYSEFESIYRSFSNFADKLDREYDILSEKLENDDKNFKKLSKYESVRNTGFEITKTVLEVKFDIHTDIYELFNILKLSSKVPFASIGKYYKILKDFTPFLKWTTVEDNEDLTDEEKKNILYIRVLNTKEDTIDSSRKEENYHFSREAENYHPSREAENYSLAELRAFHKKGEVNTITLLLESDINDELNSVELINRILDSFKGEDIYENVEIKELGIKGFFQIPKLVVYDLIIRDLAMNDNLFSNFIHIDESRQVEKIKTNIYTYFTFNSFTTENTGKDVPISSSLNQMIVQPNDYKLIDKGFKIGDKYVEIKITRATNEPDAKQFMEAFSKLLKLYEDKEHEVINKYTKYIPDFKKYIKLEKKQLEKPQRRQYLKDIVPKIFGNNSYSKDCDGRQQPDIISDEKYQVLLNDFDLPKLYFERKEERIDKPLLHAQNLLQNVKYLINKNDLLIEEQKLLSDLYGSDWKENINEYLKIPLLQGDKELFIYPRQNEVPRKYMCSGVTYTYIGVRKSRAENKILFPFVPCCYQEPQYKTEKKTFKGEKKMLAYYGGDVKLEGVVVTTYNIKTNKFIKQNQIGEFVPKNIYEFLHTIDNTKTSIYYRKGTNSDVNSALEAISIALQIPEFITVNKKGQNSFIKNKRNELIKYVEEIQQTSYQYISINNEVLINLIKNKDQYISPRFFLKALEDIFNCYIILFSLNNTNPNGYLAPPNFTQEYYDYKHTDRKYVLLYENVDNNKFHCEVIARSLNTIKKNEKTSFESDNDIIIKIRDVFKTLYISNNNNDILIPKNKIIAQQIDYFGKTRYLKFDNDIIIFTNPLPNLNVALFDINELKNLIPDKTAKKFLKQVDNYEPIYVNNKKVAYKGKHGQIEFYLQIQGEEQKEQKHSEKGQTYPPPAKGQTYSEKGQTYNEILIPINNSINYLEQFNILKRISRYILEYTFYIFSLNVLKEQKEITDEYIINFAMNNFVFDKIFKYKVVKRLFDINNTGLLKNKKLVVPDIQTLKHILYTLRLNLTNNRDEIINYSNRKYIKYYYEDINDFDEGNDFIIISGEKTLLNLILSSRNNYHITDTINVILPPKIELKKVKGEEKKGKEKDDETKEQQRDGERYNLINKHMNSLPYLFNNGYLNDLLDKNTTFIVQPVSNTKVGSYICKVYQEKGYNLGNIKTDEVKDEVKRYGVVVYNSNTNISIIGSKNINRLLLVYRIKFSYPGFPDEYLDFYNALLPTNL